MTRIMRTRTSAGRRTAAGMAAMGLLFGAALLGSMAATTETVQPREAEARTAQAGAQGSLDAILQDLAAYDFAAGVGAPMRLKAYVLAHKDDPQARAGIEAKLVAFLKSAATAGGKMEACRSLRLVGSAASVPALAGMLAEPGTTDMARYALEYIPGEEADQALLSALAITEGEVRRGIVSSLGARGTAAAAGPLARLAAGKDAALARCAARALGAIGTPEAAAALSSVLERSKGALAAEAASSLLLCADALFREGRGREAAGLYDKVFAARTTAGARQAAFKGRIAAAGDRGREMILKALAGKDAALHGPAIAMVPSVFDAAGLGPVIAAMDKLPTDSKVQLVAVLGGFDGQAVREAVIEAAQVPVPPVRMEALRALERVGDASAVDVLAARGASAVGAEQALAREVLSKLPGPEVDRTIVERLGIETDDAIRAELVRAVGSRKIEGAKPALMEVVMSGSPAVRARAAAALREIASPADIPGLLDLMAAAEDEAVREQMQDTAAAVAMKIPRPAVRANAVKARLSGEKVPRKRADLLRVLGKIGDDGSLGPVRRALSDEDAVVVDAAVRALAEWPTATARDDVYEIARRPFSVNHRVLALRAYVRMIGLEPHRSPEGATADLMKALAVTLRPEEKKLILGMLARFPCVASLKTAESLLADPAVAAEAKLAADRIRGQISTY